MTRAVYWSERCGRVGCCRAVASGCRSYSWFVWLYGKHPGFARRLVVFAFLTQAAALAAPCVEPEQGPSKLSSPLSGFPDHWAPRSSPDHPVAFPVLLYFHAWAHSKLLLCEDSSFLSNLSCPPESPSSFVLVSCGGIFMMAAVVDKEVVPSSDKEVGSSDPYEVEDSIDESEEVSEKKGTVNDRKDMYRMGKVQELRRNFRFITIFGFTMVLMATWEAQLRYELRAP